MEGLTSSRSLCGGAVQIDVALAELGMLATVTDARREYLQETLNAREQQELSQEKMLRKIFRDEKRRLLKDQHLPQDQQMAPVQQKLVPIPVGDYKAWDTERTVPLLNLAQKEIHDFPQRIHRSASSTRTRHLFMPYDRGSCQLHHRPLTLYSMHSPNDHVAHHRHLNTSFVHRATGGHYVRPVAAARSTCSSLTSSQVGLLQLPRQLPQNKSNPPSPVKSHPLLVGVEAGCGTPLVRSRSLDNIALCPLAASAEDGTSLRLVSGAFSTATNSPRLSRVDTSLVESVSSRIGSLQLTAN